MNRLQLLKIKKLWNPYSETVYGFDLRKTPPYIKKDVPKAEFDLATNLPIIPVGDGILMVNEAFSEWKAVKDLLVALDTLPRSLLEDVLTMEEKRYPDKEKASNLEGLPAGEQARRIVFMFLP